MLTDPDKLTDAEVPATAMVSALLSVIDDASVTRAVKVNVPAWVAVPLMLPPEDSASPAGSEPADMSHARGAVPPVAASVCE